MKRPEEPQAHFFVGEAAGVYARWTDYVALLIYAQQLESALAECYRLTGADPDGAEDWRLAQMAVEEVRRMRRDATE